MLARVKTGRVLNHVQARYTGPTMHRAEAVNRTDLKATSVEMYDASLGLHTRYVGLSAAGAIKI